MSLSNPTAVLHVSCPDQRGIIAALATFITGHHGNIISLDQHVDNSDGVFFARIEWEMAGFNLSEEKFAELFQPLAEERNITWALRPTHRPLRMGVLVSKQSHCLHDILARYESREWPVDIPVVISNHNDLRESVERQGIPFHHIPVDARSKAENEPRQIQLLKEHHVDFVVLARYMQILSPAFVQAFPRRIINIHHSFLPAFAGAKPYHAAHERGVKIIGATAHYVTENLDEGPIIEQDIFRVTHKQGVADLIRLGRDLEKVVLSRAIYAHLNHNILVYKNRTIVFD